MREVPFSITVQSAVIIGVCRIKGLGRWAWIGRYGRRELSWKQFLSGLGRRQKLRGRKKELSGSISPFKSNGFINLIATIKRLEAFRSNSKIQKIINFYILSSLFDSKQKSSL